MKISIGGLPPTVIPPVPLDPLPQSIPNVAAMAQPTAAPTECEVVSGEPERKGLWRRFLSFYERSAKSHPSVTGVTTSFVITFGGDLVAKGITEGRFPIHLDLQQLGHLGVILALCAYYGMESPEIFRRIDVAFPLERPLYKAEDHSAPFLEGAKIMTGRRTVWGAIKRLMSSFGKRIAATKRRIAGSGQSIRRAMAYRFAIAPWWTMRHMAYLGLLHGSTATPSEIVWRSLYLWAAWFFPLSVEEYLVQNKIPLEQRFLATSVGGFIWQISASLMVLLGCR